STIFALPVFALPEILGGTPVPHGLVEATWLGLVALVVTFAAFGLFLLTDRPLRWFARQIQRVLNLLRPGVRAGRRPRSTDLPERLVAQRDQVRSTLQERWWVALLAALG